MRNNNLTNGVKTSFHGTNNSNKKSRSSYQIEQEQKALPISRARQSFLEEVKKADTSIVIGETACGKTTQIPQYLLRAGYARTGKIACTQPRRVAAITVAERVACELSTTVGDKVGYRVRFDDKTSAQTKIKYMTDGMLLREALGDRLLSQYSFIILDEAHERTINTDVLFGIVKEAQAARKKNDRMPDLKLIIMSATMDADRFSEYFNAPVLYIEGRQHEVKTKYIKTPSDDYLAMAISTVFKIHKEAPAGDDILVFLTGQDEIESTLRSIKEISSTLPSNLPTLKVFPLYASLPNNQQVRAFRATGQNTRKVVLSTNIAETSVTILGIKYVIDTGKVKTKTFDPTVGLDVLKVGWISQAQAWQRSGRAGRQRSGVVMRLYSEETFKRFSVETVPEIKRCNASNVILQLLAIGVPDVTSFDFMDAPSHKSIASALDELRVLGAVEKEEGGRDKLTPFGRVMSAFPLEPKLSKALIVAQKHECVEEMLTLIALLSVENVLFSPQGKGEQAAAAHRRFAQSEGDMLTLMKVCREFKRAKSAHDWCYENFVNHRSLSQAMDIRAQLRELCVQRKIVIKSQNRDATALRRCIASGMFANAAEYQQDGTYRSLHNGQQVHIHPSSCLFRAKPAYVVYGDVVQTSKCYMRTLCVVDPEWLHQAAPEYFRSKLKLSST